MFKKKPYFVAEISANHVGSIKKAIKLIYQAKKYGADAVKLQTYTPDGMTLNFKNKYFKLKSGIWRGKYLWELYNQAKTPHEWHKKLFDYAKKINITIFSSPFDKKSLELLESLRCPIYKLASFEINDIPLIKLIAKTKKPIIISTGMANIKEIETAYKTAKKFGARKISLLYCVSNYPSKLSDFNMNMIGILKKKFNCPIGFSDHSKDNRVAFSAISAGAEIVEKHIALKNQKKGLDLEFSIRGDEIKKFRQDIDTAYSLIKKKSFTRSIDEKNLRIQRRSIFASEKILKSEKFTKKNIRIIRPGHGIEPIYFNKLIGKESPFSFKEGYPITNKVLTKLKII